MKYSRQKVKVQMVATPADDEEEHLDSLVSILLKENQKNKDVRKQKDNFNQR